MTVADDMKKRLFDLGHFRNPAKPTGVTEADLPGLKLHETPVRIAFDSFRDSMGIDFDRLSNEQYGRQANTTAEIEEVTAKLFDVERCGYPDYSIEAANGSGSWPSGCHPAWKNNHAFSIQVNKSGMPSYLQPIFEQAFDLVRQAYANIGMVFVREDNNDRANTLVTWQRGAGWIGLAIVPRSPRCGERIWAKFDNRYQPSQLLDQWARLLAHELGHNMGMSHSRGGIMNPSIVGGPFTPTAWRGDPSESILKRYFGGVPVNLGGTPAPPVDPTPPPTGIKKLYFTGSFKARDEAGNDLGDYILVPNEKV